MTFKLKMAVRAVTFQIKEDDSSVAVYKLPVDR